MSTPIQVPQKALEAMQDLVDLCKAAGVMASKYKERAEELEKKAAEVTPTVVTAPSKFTREQLISWAEQSKQAGVLDERADTEKVAALIQASPDQFIDILLQAQLPPDTQGSALSKEASDNQISGAVLKDYDGWLDCIEGVV